MSDKKTIGKNTKNTALATFLVMLGLIFSRGSGMLRDIVVSDRFTDIYRDSFTLAFTIPDLFYNLLIGGAIYTSVAPYMSGALAVNEEERGVRVVSIFISVVSTVMVIACAIGCIFAKPLYMVYNSSGKGINPETLDLASSASRFLFPQVIFIMGAALCIGILNAYRRFSSTAFGPTVYNIFVLVAIVIFGGNSPRNLMLTTMGILIAAVIYFLYQYFIGFDKLKQFRFIFKPGDKEFQGLLKRALPIMFSSSVVQINVMVLNYFAGKFDNGSIFALRNASTIWQIPYGVFTVAISTVMTPNIAGFYASKKYDETSKLLSSSLRSALFIAIPCFALVAILPVDVVKAIYQWSSNYTNEDAARAAVFLTGYSLAIVTHSVVHLFNQAFNSIGRTKIPLIAGCIGLISNPIVCSILISANVGPKSLTIAYTTTSILQMLVLVILYCRDKEIAPHGIFKFLVKSGVCVVIMAVITIIINKYLVTDGNKIMQLLYLAIKGVIALVVYFAIAFVLKIDEATVWLDKFKSKLLRRVSTN